jgi:hypothetical protein
MLPPANNQLVWSGDASSHFISILSDALCWGMALFLDLIDWNPTWFIGHCWEQKAVTLCFWSDLKCASSWIRWLPLTIWIWIHSIKMYMYIYIQCKGIQLTLWTRWAAFAASMFPCLLIDGNADSRGTLAVFQTVTLFYAVCKIFPSKSFIFDQIKSGFLLREWYLAAIFS